MDRRKPDRRKINTIIQGPTQYKLPRFFFFKYSRIGCFGTMQQSQFIVNRREWNRRKLKGICISFQTYEVVSNFI